MRRMMVTVTMVAAVISLMLLGTAAPALADMHEVECYSCHTDGSQGAAGELKELPAGHPSAAAGDDAYGTSLPATGLMVLAPVIGLLAAGAGVMIYRKR